METKLISRNPEGKRKPNEYTLERAGPFYRHSVGVTKFKSHELLIARVPTILYEEKQFD